MVYGAHASYSLRRALAFSVFFSFFCQHSRALLQPVRVAFLTDCTPYSDWMSLGMIYSFKMSGQPGKVTRVMCCTEAEKARYSPVLLNEVETHTAPSFTFHPVSHDYYPPYNKPEAVIDYLKHVTPEEEYVLVLDSDMILRRPFLVEVMKPEKGLSVGARYTCMTGVNNELAMRHVPEVLPRNDSLAGPVGRRGDQVGGFFFTQRDDLKRMSTLWLKYTEDVRADDMAYKYSGDVWAIHPGDKPWISEMYGYAYGASKADLWHKWDTFSMLYPGYKPRTSTEPKLMHYGLLFEVGGYKFDKHRHFDFNVTKCPPWDLSNPKQRTEGLFKHPPRISSLKNQAQITEYYRDILAIETVNTLNAAFCDFHVRHCPPSQQLLTECQLAHELYVETSAEAHRIEAKLRCYDFDEKCAEWSKDGQCDSNHGFMSDFCKASCKLCVDPAYDLADLAPQSRDLEINLVAMEKKLAAGTGSTADPDAKAARATLAARKVSSPRPPLPPPKVEEVFQDSEDLSVSVKEVVATSNSPSNRAGVTNVGPKPTDSFSIIPIWMTWSLAIMAGAVLALIVIFRLSKLRRRSRSGRRTE